MQLLLVVLVILILFKLDELLIVFKPEDVTAPAAAAVVAVPHVDPVVEALGSFGFGVAVVMAIVLFPAFLRWYNGRDR